MKSHQRMEFESILLHFYTIQMPVCLPGQKSNNVGMSFNKHMKIWWILMDQALEGRVEDYYAMSLHVRRSTEHNTAK